MERYDAANPPFICSSCPRKTYGYCDQAFLDCDSLLIHSVLSHDKAYVMEMHNQASTKLIIENSLVKESEPVQAVQQNLKGSATSKKRKSAKTSPKSARKSPRLGPATQLIKLQRVSCNHFLRRTHAPRTSRFWCARIRARTFILWWLHFAQHQHI